MDISVFRVLRSLLLVLFIAVVEYRRGSFTRSGVLTGFLLCFLIAYSNIVFLFVMITFVLTGSFATRYKFDYKQSKMHEGEHAARSNRYKKTARDYKQVLCNGAVGCLYALGYCWRTNYSGQSVPLGSSEDSSIWTIGFLSTMACCCGDTLASELGSVLAAADPRLLTNPFRTVPVGTNGGVTFVGCLFSLLGGAIVGISYLAGNVIFCRSDQLTDTSMINLQLFVYCTLFGLLGSMIDSLLGATLQFSGYDRDRHMTVQTPGPFIEHISGWNLLSNNQVNLLSSLFTSLIAVVLLPKLML